MPLDNDTSPVELSNDTEHLSEGEQRHRMEQADQELWERVDEEEIMKILEDYQAGLQQEAMTASPTPPKRSRRAMNVTMSLRPTIASGSSTSPSSVQRSTTTLSLPPLVPGHALHVELTLQLAEAPDTGSMVSPHGLVLDEDRSEDYATPTMVTRHSPRDGRLDEEPTEDSTVLMQRLPPTRGICCLTDLKAWLESLPPQLRGRHLRERQALDERCLHLLETFLEADGTDVEVQLPHYVEMVVYQFLQDSGYMGEDSQTLIPTEEIANDSRRRRTATSSASLPPGDVNFWARNRPGTAVDIIRTRLDTMLMEGEVDERHNTQRLVVLELARQVNLRVGKLRRICSRSLLLRDIFREALQMLDALELPGLPDDGGFLDYDWVQGVVGTLGPFKPSPLTSCLSWRMPQEIAGGSSDRNATYGLAPPLPADPVALASRRTVDTAINDTQMLPMDTQAVNVVSSPTLGPPTTTGDRCHLPVCQGMGFPLIRARLLLIVPTPSSKPTTCTSSPSAPSSSTPTTRTTSGPSSSSTGTGAVCRSPGLELGLLRRDEGGQGHRSGGDPHPTPKKPPLPRRLVPVRAPTL